MFTVVDIDCTLYSYSELILSQKRFVFSLLRSVLSKNSHLLYNNVDRACEKYNSHIKERIQFLMEFFGEEKVVFYSSYPLTEMKKSFLSSFPMKAYSSFPHRKTAQEIQKLCGGSIKQVVGDRKEDRELAQSLGASWRGYPYYDFHHLLWGDSYTKAFISLVKGATQE